MIGRQLVGRRTRGGDDVELPGEIREGVHWRKEREEIVVAVVRSGECGCRVKQ